MQKHKKDSRIGVIHVHATYTNTVITLTTLEGHVLGWSSCGTMGFKGSRRSTFYGAKVVAENIAHKAKQFDIQHLKITLKGFGPGRDSSLRVFSRSKQFRILLIKDVTPIAYNGCRPRKARKK